MYEYRSTTASRTSVRNEGQVPAVRQSRNHTVDVMHHLNKITFQTQVSSALRYSITTAQHDRRSKEANGGRVGLAAGVGNDERATTYKALRLTLPCGGFKRGRRVPVPAHLLGRCQRQRRITARATRGAAAATYVTGV